MSTPANSQPRQPEAGDRFIQIAREFSTDQKTYLLLFCAGHYISALYKFAELHIAQLEKTFPQLGSANSQQLVDARTKFAGLIEELISDPAGEAGEGWKKNLKP